MSLGTTLLIVLMLMLIGAFPSWPYELGLKAQWCVGGVGCVGCVGGVGDNSRATVNGTAVTRVDSELIFASYSSTLIDRSQSFKGV